VGVTVVEKRLAGAGGVVELVLGGHHVGADAHVHDDAPDLGEICRGDVHDAGGERGPPVAVAPRAPDEIGREAVDVGEARREGSEGAAGGGLAADLDLAVEHVGSGEPEGREHGRLVGEALEAAAGGREDCQMAQERPVGGEAVGVGGVLGVAEGELGAVLGAATAVVDLGLLVGGAGSEVVEGVHAHAVPDVDLRLGRLGGEAGDDGRAGAGEVAAGEEDDLVDAPGAGRCVVHVGLDGLPVHGVLVVDDEDAVSGHGLEVGAELALDEGGVLVEGADAPAAGDGSPDGLEDGGDADGDEGDGADGDHHLDEREADAARAPPRVVRVCGHGSAHGVTVKIQGSTGAGWGR